jgi:hypothetical protein
MVDIILKLNGSHSMIALKQNFSNKFQFLLQNSSPNTLFVILMFFWLKIEAKNIKYLKQIYKLI